MIPLSGRHSLLAVVALWAFAAATAFHSLVRPVVDDCADPAALLAPNLFSASVAGSESSTRSVKYSLAQSQGRIPVREPWQNGPLWRVLRTYDLTSSYFAPPGLFSMVSSEDRDWIVMRPGDGGELPIHVRVDDSAGYANVAAYLYVFAGEPVAHPFAASVGVAIRQLLKGTLPITVIVAEGDTELGRSEVSQEFLVDWIRSAWSEFDAVCGS